MYGLKDKVALITGSSSGIGRAVAIEFARQGAKVFLTGRSEEQLKIVADECLQVNRGGQAKYSVVDLMEEKGAKFLADAVLKQYGTVDILVNNAGMISADDKPIRETKDVKWFDIYNHLYVRVPWLLSGYFMDELIKNKGSIVNVTATITTMATNPRFPAYATMKAALEELSRSMAVDLASVGVRVNVVKPGSTITPFARGFNLTPDMSRNMVLQHCKNCVPLGQCPNEPADTAHAIVFLASDLASRITGTILPVDGGLVLAHPMYNFNKSK